MGCRIVTLASLRTGGNTDVVAGAAIRTALAVLSCAQMDLLREEKIDRFWAKGSTERGYHDIDCR
jgi:hypothetical protein